ncbi:PKD domain-containing protein [Pararhodonellum marinum]|uniref:PKD domain-containing protein n=1 Tax=Pararhodonellum marinum TaxID=2755358 RepID=UPI00188F91EA|nr:hypothetical protein [Pararhodonellum marinum]
MKTIQKLLLASLWVILFAACDTDDTLPTLTNKLQANAGTDREVPLGIAVELNGTASKDGNNKPFSYEWSFKSKPENSTAILEGASHEKSTFTPDQLGDYTIELKIANETGESKASVKITAVNSNAGVTIILDQDITQDRILFDIHDDPTVPDYIVSVNLAVKAKLTVQPGVVIAFEEKKGMLVQQGGILIAKGEMDKKIQFIGKAAAKGYWAGIVIQTNSPFNEFQHVEIKDAGSQAVYPLLQATALGLAGNSYLRIAQSTILQSLGHGFWVSPTASMDFSQNAFRQNDGVNMVLPVNEVHKLDAETVWEAHSQDANYVEVTGPELIIQGNITWPKLSNQTRYRISENLVIKSNLTLEMGAKIGVAPDRFIRVLGSLHAKGSQLDQISMEVWPAGNHKWGGLVFHSASDLNRLEWVEIRHAGNNQKGYGMDQSAAIGVDGAQGGKLNLVNTKILGSNAYGLYVEQGAVLGDFEKLSVEAIKGKVMALPAAMVYRVKDLIQVAVQNQNPAVEVVGFSLNETEEAVWGPLPGGMTYYLPNQLDVTSGLKLLPGVKLEFNQHAMLAILHDGYLIAKGTSQKNIEFKGSVDQKGYWRGIIFRSNSNHNVMEHTLVSGAGGLELPWTGGRKASIGVFPGGTGLQLKNSKILKSGGWGILVDTSFGAIINPDVESSNQFEDVSSGNIIRL